MEIAEQEHIDALFEEVINNAAVLVATGRHSRGSAYQTANDRNFARQEAISKGEYSEDEDSNTMSFLTLR
jgi:hypothetical protein